MFEEYTEKEEVLDAWADLRTDHYHQAIANGERGYCVECRQLTALLVRFNQVHTFCGIRLVPKSIADQAQQLWDATND